MSFPKYAAYKDSGIDWLSSIPEAWSVAPLKRLFTIVSGSTPKSDDETFWDGPIAWATPADLSNVRGVHITETNRTITDAGLASCATALVPTGSIIVSTRAPIGSIAIASMSLCTNQGCKALVALAGSFPAYFYYVLRSAVRELNIRGKGTTFLELSTDELASFQVPVPSRLDQIAVAAFLDRETAKIDALVAEQERLIALLKEKRRAVISNAVTKGLEPNAPMKDSGVDWLGRVPASWKVCSARYVASVFVPQRNKPDLNEDGDGTAWITMEQMGTGIISASDYWVSGEAATLAGSRVLPEGATIASCVGNFGVAAVNLIPVIINQQLQAFVPESGVSPAYLKHLVSLSKSYFERVATAATLPYVNQEAFGGLTVLVPPTETQEAILQHLERSLADIDGMIKLVAGAISLLSERRSAVISAAVTGKIDVRAFVPVAEKAA